MGASGSGKSTILKLLPRQYDPYDGAVLVDKQDLRSVSIASVRKQIGLGPQDTVLFDESMLYNLMYGDLNATEADALEVGSGFSSICSSICLGRTLGVVFGEFSSNSM